MITQIHQDDAEGVHQLMLKNANRFKRYFPETLKKNLTLKLAKEFTLLKADEFINKQEFLFVLKKEQEVIGLVYIKELDWKVKQGEFAYCIDEKHQGKGLISKAIDKLISYAFNELVLEVLQILVHKDNLASVKVAKKNQFAWQKTMPKSFTPPNEEPLDMELYELYKTSALKN